MRVSINLRETEQLQVDDPHEKENEREQRKEKQIRKETPNNKVMRAPNAQ